MLKKGAEAEYNDPHIPILPRMRHYPNLRMASQQLSPEYLASRDCVVILTDHTAYDWAYIVRHAALVIDTRNATKAVESHRDRIVKA